MRLESRSHAGQNDRDKFREVCHFQVYSTKCTHTNLDDIASYTLGRLM